MLAKRQFSLGYLLLELSCIAVSIGLVRSIYLTWNLMQPRPWVYTIPAAIVVVPAAIGGLFGQMRIGAIIGFALMVLYLLGVLFRGFPADYDRPHW
jgi:hypothetical protein